MNLRAIFQATPKNWGIGGQERCSLLQKYGVILPEYAMDTDLLMDKITALLHDEGSGIITVTLGAATSVFSSLVNVLLALVFALYLLAKKGGRFRAPENPCCDSAAAKKCAAGTAHCIADQTDLYPFCDRSAYRGCYHRYSVLFGYADFGHPVCRGSFCLCRRYGADSGVRRVDRRRSWCVFDSAGRPSQSGVVCSVPAEFCSRSRAI